MLKLKNRIVNYSDDRNFPNKGFSKKQLEHIGGRTWYRAKQLYSTIIDAINKAQIAIYFIK